MYVIVNNEIKSERSAVDTILFVIEKIAVDPDHQILVSDILQALLEVVLVECIVDERVHTCQIQKLAPGCSIRH